jgi:hypothetical protein
MSHTVTTSTITNTAGNQVKSVACSCGTTINIPGLDNTSSQYALVQATVANHSATGR